MSHSVNEVRLNAFFHTLSEELTCSLGVHGPARDRLVHRMRKRAGFVNHDLEEVAIAKFLEVNKTLQGFTHAIQPDDVNNARHFILVMLERYTTNRSDINIQNPLDEVLLYDDWRYGPGSSNGVKGTHAADKIEQRMTCTSLCEPYVRRLRGNNPYFLALDSKLGSGITPIYGSKLTTVPKNEDTVRTIAIEPLGNMCMQLAAGRYLEGTLSYIGLDITQQQPKNKLLAQRGSIDGSVCTIDLKSASDMISISLVRALLPPKWFKLLMNIRSPIMMVKGDQVELNMMSTMGNGFTFPLMTLILCSLIYAVRCRHGGPNLYIDWSSTAVFGDDIIVPTKEYTELTEILGLAGLVVNHDKSYYEGPFRESCGGDYMDGVDITPFYVKNLRNDPEIYVVINQLLEWSAKHGLWPMRSYDSLIKMLHKGPFFVPEWYGSYQGVRTSQVARKFKHYSLVHKKIPYSGDFTMMLACGGYITGSTLPFIGDDSDSSKHICKRKVDPRPFFTPRVKAQKYEARSSRLPKGYLDGADPLSRSVVLSSRIAMIVAMAA